MLDKKRTLGTLKTLRTLEDPKDLYKKRRIMKKTYINPETVVIPFVATQPIAQSITGVGGNTGIILGDGETPADADVKVLNDLNRSIWDNEW